MIKKLILSGAILTMCTSCTQWTAILMSSGGFVAGQNAYSKVYNGVDIFSIMSTKKSIKNHIYDKRETYLYKRDLETIGRPR